MSNIKYEFVKETNFKNETIYYTKKDGCYLSDTLSMDENKARELFNIVTERGDMRPIVEVLETKYNG